MTDQEKARFQELRSNYDLLCMKYKQLKKETTKKDEIIVNQDKTINELTQKVNAYEKKLNL